MSSFYTRLVHHYQHHYRPTKKDSELQAPRKGGDDENNARCLFRQLDAGINGKAVEAAAIEKGLKAFKRSENMVLKPMQLVEDDETKKKSQTMRRSKSNQTANSKAGPRSVIFDSSTMYKIVTWNVNGIRSLLKRQASAGNVSLKYQKYLSGGGQADANGYVSDNQLQHLADSESPDIICLQETKLSIETDNQAIGRLDGYVHVDSVATTRKGYSGVRTYLKMDTFFPDHVLDSKSSSTAGKVLDIRGVPVAYSLDDIIGCKGKYKAVFPHGDQTVIGTHRGNPEDAADDPSIKKPFPFDKETKVLSNHHEEGRLVLIHLPHENLYLLNTYVPNSGMPMVDKRHKRVIVWDDKIRRVLNELTSLKSDAPTSSSGSKKKITSSMPTSNHLLWTGDFNCADLDTDRYWGDYAKYSVMCQDAGFTPEERLSWRKTLRECNLVDCFTWLYPKHYLNSFTYWSARANGRVGNRGWRIDSFCASYSLCGGVNKVGDIFTVNKKKARDAAKILSKPKPANPNRIVECYPLDAFKTYTSSDHGPVALWLLKNSAVSGGSSNKLASAAKKTAVRAIKRK